MFHKEVLGSKEKAIQQYDAAFHLLNVTFPLVRDPKLLIGVINNIFSSLEYSMDTILEHERQLKLVPPYPENFQSKLNIFRYRSMKRNNVPNPIVNLMMELRELLDLHKRSPMEFQRGNRFVICSKDYRLKVISIKEIREYLNQNKEFLDIMERTINRYRKI